jgi:hypothetical protein
VSLVSLDSSSLVQEKKIRDGWFGSSLSICNSSRRGLVCAIF